MHDSNQVNLCVKLFWKQMDNDEPILRGPRLVRDNDELWWDYSPDRQWRPFCDCVMLWRSGSYNTPPGTPIMRETQIGCAPFYVHQKSRNYTGIHHFPPPGASCYVNK